MRTFNVCIPIINSPKEKHPSLSISASFQISSTISSAIPEFSKIGFNIYFGSKSFGKK
jgi:hypothetical protein